MVATIIFGNAQATLDDAGVWRSSNAIWAGYLNTLYNVMRFPPTPADGASIFAGQVRAAAKGLNAEIEWEHSGVEVEGRVY